MTYQEFLNVVMETRTLLADGADKQQCLLYLNTAIIGCSDIPAETRPLVRVLAWKIISGEELAIN